MPIFYLEPRGGDTSDRSWEATYLREGCWTEAKTELVAREKVAGATVKIVDVKPGKRMKSYSPWVQPRLTDCTPDTPSRAVPAGKVLTKSGKIFDA
jgi:hypothetical protein